MQKTKPKTNPTKATKTSNRFDAARAKVKAAAMPKRKAPAAVTPPAKQRRGFAVMTAEQRGRIAAMGGAKVRRKFGKGYFAKIGAKGGANSHGGNKTT